jgi:hypothetical protein
MANKKKLIQYIREGIESGIDQNFDPIKYLEKLKSNKKNSLKNIK